MPKYAKLTIGLSITLIAILGGVFLFLYYLVTKSFPVVEGTLNLPVLRAPVEIIRDEYGVPHINASDEHDLMVAAGFVHAQDRLFQMEILRRAGEGRLSELFDTTTVKFDKLFRTLGLTILAESLEQHLHPTSQRLLEDYTKGVNAYIEMSRGKYPIEFDMLNFEPETWKVKHSILIARLMSWQLSFSWWVDLTYAEIAERVPIEKFQEIIPSSRQNTGPFVPKEKLKFIHSDGQTFLNDVRVFREFMKLGSLSAGSNAWAVGPSKSLSGKPILANDPHLKISLPAQWYEMHLTAPGWNVAGVSLPGIPLIVIGHNDSIAWGFTNAMIDDADFYLEKVDTATPNSYLFKNVSMAMSVREEKIYIGKKDSVEIIVRSTHHGPIINDVHPRSMHRHPDSMMRSTPISLRWTGFEIADEFLAFYRMNRATNKVEFENALQGFTTPAQCAVYVDVQGNFCLWVVGNVPIRRMGNPLLPLVGWTGDEEWVGYIPFDKLPRRINPAEGFILSANQAMVDSSYPYYLSVLWEHPSRSQRISELLSSTEKFSAEDFKQFQQDVVSYYGKELTEHILKEYQSESFLDNETRIALEYIRNWDYRCTQYDIATTILQVFFVKLLHNLYEDEMGSEVFADFVYFSAIPYRVTSQLMASDNSLWFDDVRTEQRETKSDIIRKSLSDALSFLTSKLGTDTKLWQWGSLHTVTFEHPLGNVKPLERVLNVGPYPLGGSGTTINKAAFNLIRPFSCSVGPSMRQVIDMANPSIAYMVNPPGQVGQPMHQHYDDQTLLWLNGGYRTVITDWNLIYKLGWKRLELRPE